MSRRKAKPLELTDEERDFLKHFAETKEQESSQDVRDKCSVAFLFRKYPEAKSFLSIEFRRAMPSYAKAWQWFPAFLDCKHPRYIFDWSHDFLRCLVAATQLPKKRAIEYVEKELTLNVKLQMQYATQARINEIKAELKPAARKAMLAERIAEKVNGLRGQAAGDYIRQYHDQELMNQVIDVFANEPEVAAALSRRAQASEAK